MKILLVQSWLGPSRDLPVYPLGLAYLATSLEARGYEVKVFDPNTATAPLAETAQAVRSFAPDAVGLSLRNLDNQLRIMPFYYYKYFQETLAVLRGACGGAPLIVGGPAFSMLPELIMQRNPGLDLGLVLEAEEAFPELLENLGAPQRVKGVYYRQEDGGLEFTGHRPMPDFAALPFPRRHFLDLAPYAAGGLESVGVQTRRGCPLACAYCVYPHLGGRRWRLRRPEHVLEELEYLRRDCGVRRVTFADSVVNLPYDYSTRIFTLLRDSGLGLEWLAYMHVQGVTGEYLRLCLESGCKSLIFSPDALSQRALDTLHKGLTPGDVYALRRLLDSDPAFRELRVEWCFFVNPPGETLAGLWRTLWFFLRSKRFMGARNRNAFINWIRLEPSSACYALALEQGVVSPDTDLLPEDPALLARTFYSAPHLAWLDPAIMALLRLPKRARRLLGRLRGSAPPPSGDGV